MDCHDPGHLWLGWSSLFYIHLSREQLVFFLLGEQLKLGIGSPTLVHLDGGDFVSLEIE